MRTTFIAAVLALAPAAAYAGPSDHAGRPFGEFARTERREARPAARVLGAPYALTGQPIQHRVLQFRDAPKGHGQTEKVAFWTWATE